MNKKMSKKDLQIALLKNQLQLMHSYVTNLYELNINNNYEVERGMSRYKMLADSIMSQNGMEVD